MISASSGLGLLQMVSESHTGLCASEEAGHEAMCQQGHWIAKGGEL